MRCIYENQDKARWATIKIIGQQTRSRPSHWEIPKYKIGLIEMFKRGSIGIMHTPLTLWACLCF